MASRKTDINEDKYNEDSIENSESDGSTGNKVILSTPKEGRLWFLNKLARKEDIGMPEFCNEFGLLRSRPQDDPKNDESSGHSTARNASLSSSLLLKSSSAALSSSKKRKLPTMDGGSLSGVAMKTVEEEAQAFFSAAGSLQDILFSSLQDGRSLPAWAKNRPLYQFKLRLREEWGSRVTELYESAKRKALLDHTHVDEIVLLSGIVHFNKRHGFSEQEIKTITASVLEMFYSQEMKEEDIQRAQDAVLLWASWVKKWKRLLVNEKVAAQRENRDPLEAIDTEPVVEAILRRMQSARTRRSHRFFILRCIWATLVSESDCLMGVVGPILKEVMAVQHEIKFICANACTSVGKTRKAQLQQDGQSRQPDVIGLTKAKEEIFYGELKGPPPRQRPSTPMSFNMQSFPKILLIKCTMLWWKDLRCSQRI
ncbi:hypothetical protein BGZ91_010696 [Linnemannia elongata]|nr:hypothetical protein BGZ91_010696 [Linnemannia elongata]